MDYQHRVQNHRLTPSRRKIGKAIARRSKASVVAQCMKDNVMFNYIIRISRILQSELRKLCSVDSLLKVAISNLYNFSSLCFISLKYQCSRYFSETFHMEDLLSYCNL